MNLLQFSFLCLFCTATLPSSCDETAKSAVNSVNVFTFDLSNPKQSNEYVLTQIRNYSTTTSVLEPFANKRLTKIVDDHENVANFLNDQLVTKVVFSPSVNPKLLSVTYLKNNMLHTSRFRKLYGWNEVTLDDYNYLMYDLSRATMEVVLDLSKLDRELFSVKRENYSKFELFNVTVPQGYIVTKVVTGKQLVWQSENDERVTSAFVSTESNPGMLCLSVTRGNVIELKTFTNFDGVYNEVAMSEFRFVLDSFMTKTSTDSESTQEQSGHPFVGKTLDLTYPDVSDVELTYGVLDGMAFVNMHPLNAAKNTENKPENRVTRVLLNGYELWKSTNSSHCLNVAYTVESEPRLYNILVTEEKSGKNVDKFLYYMNQNNTLYSLPELEYEKKVAELASSGRSVFKRPASKEAERGHVFDLQVFMEKLGKEESRTLMYTPAQGSKVSRVVCGNDLVWVSSKFERLDQLYFFKTGNKRLLQLMVTDANNSPTTNYFMCEESAKETTVDSKVDDKTAGEAGSHETKTTAAKASTVNKWLWISSPLFFSNVAHVQLVKTYLSLDVTGKLNRGVLYHKKGALGRVFVQTFTTYPSNLVTSLFEKDRCMWTASENEEALSVCLFTSNNTEELKGVKSSGLNNQETKKLAELYVKVGDKVKRVFLTNKGDKWEKVEEDDFKFMYNKL